MILSELNLCLYSTVQIIWPLRQVFIYDLLRRNKQSQVYTNGANQGCTNKPIGRLFEVAIKFYRAETNICPTSAWNLLYIAFFGP